MDMEHLISGYEPQEERIYPISSYIGKDIKNDERRDATLYSVVCDDESALWYALVLEQDSSEIKIFDGRHGLIKVVSIAVDEHYHHNTIQVSTSILFAAVFARTHKNDLEISQ